MGITKVDIANLKHEYAKLHSEANEVVANAAKVGRMTAEDTQSNEKRYARMDEIKAVVDAVKNQARFDTASFDDGFTTNAKAERVAGNDKAEREAFAKFILTGQRNQFTIDSTSGSGVLIPEQMGTPIGLRKNVNAYRAATISKGYQPLRSSQHVTLSLPLFDDSANAGAAQSESATSQTVAEQSVSELSLAPTLYTSKGVWFSNTTLGAPGFDVLSYVIPQLERRVDLAQEAAWHTAVKTDVTASVTSATASTITLANVLNWEHQLSVAYRSDQVAVVADSFYKLLRGLVDSNGRPILELDPSTMISSIHGIQIFVSDSVEAVATGKTVGVLFSADAFKIYDSGSPRLTRYVNSEHRPDQTGLELFVNGSAKMVPSAAVKFNMA